MGIIVENKLITLNTRYATLINGTALSSVEFPFKGVLTDDDNIISANICVMNAQLPVSWYIINDSNNEFRFDIYICNVTFFTISNDIVIKF